MSKTPIFNEFEKEVWSRSTILSRPEFKSIQDLFLYGREHHPETYYMILREEAQALGITEKTN